MPPQTPRTPSTPTTERDVDELQSLLDAVPQPFEALDVSALDGFLCGVLVQPIRVPPSRWMAHVVDADGRALPPAHDLDRLRELTLRRHAELDAAIAARQWFDPWVFELDDADEASPSESVYGWVAGFAMALDLFPALMDCDAVQISEPLALLYRHLDPDDLEDADDLLELIESLEPPVNLSEAVEELVRATLLLADVGRPLQPVKRPTPRRR